MFNRSIPRIHFDGYLLVTQLPANAEALYRYNLTSIDSGFIDRYDTWFVMDDFVTDVTVTFDKG